VVIEKLIADGRIIATEIVRDSLSRRTTSPPSGPNRFPTWVDANSSIEDGDESTFVGERAPVPAEPVPDPPSYRDKWRRRW
jgi:hypothetical protein